MWTVLNRLQFINTLQISLLLNIFVRIFHAPAKLISLKYEIRNAKDLVPQMISPLNFFHKKILPRFLPLVYVAWYEGRVCLSALNNTFLHCRHLYVYLWNYHI